MEAVYRRCAAVVSARTFRSSFQCSTCRTTGIACALHSLPDNAPMRAEALPCPPAHPGKLGLSFMHYPLLVRRVFQELFAGKRSDRPKAIDVFFGLMAGDKPRTRRQSVAPKSLQAAPKHGKFARSRLTSLSKPAAKSRAQQNNGGVDSLEFHHSMSSRA